MLDINSLPLMLKVCEICATAILAGSNVGNDTTTYEDNNNTNIGGMRNGEWGRTDYTD